MRLSEAETTALTRWQHALVKRCDARTALGVAPANANDGDIDTGVLRAQLQQDGSDAIPTLETPQERVVFGTPRLNQSTTASAWNVGDVRVAAALDNSICTLRINDMVVYQTLLAVQVPIEARLPTGGMAQPWLARPFITHGIGSSYVGVSGGGLWDAMQGAIRPDAATCVHVAQRLGVTPAAAHRLFAPQPELSFVSAMQVLHGDNMPWFSRATPDIMGAAEDIATLFSRDELRTRLHLVMRTAPWPTLASTRRQEAAWLTLEATVRIGQLRGSRPTTRVRLETLQIAPPTWVGPYVGTRCLQDRAAMLLGSHAAMPAWASIAEPCAGFDDETRPLGYTDGVYMDLLPQVMRDVAPGPHVDWHGWDTVLLRVASDLQHNQQDIAQTLDPHGQAPAIDRLGDSLAMLQEAAAAYPHLQTDSAAIAHMVGRQALRGRVASATRLQAMLATMDQAFAAFPDASRTWVAQLEDRDMLQDATFATVQHLTPAYIQQAHEAADIAARYHDAYFRDHVYGAILQTRPSMHNLHTYIDTTRRRHALERE